MVTKVARKAKITSSKKVTNKKKVGFKSVKKSTKKKKGPVKLKGNSVTYVALVVDRSGSMASIYESALGGVNEQVKTLREGAKNSKVKTYVTCVQFDDTIETLFSQKDATTLKEFKTGDFSPRGVTAMRDGMFKAIQDLETVKNAPDDVGFLVITISDGMENASKDITQEALAARISTLQKTGKWTFTYMLANQNAAAVAQAFNSPVSNASTFIPSSAGVSAAYSTLSSSTSGYLRSRSAGITAVSDFYDKSGNGTIATVNPSDQLNITATSPNTPELLKTKKNKTQSSAK